MNKFNIGDIVTAVEGAPYLVTTSDATMKVLGYNNDGNINVIILAHDTSPSRIGGEFWDINPRYMMLVRGHTTVTLDGNFNIISGDLTDDEQKDFYTALQEWQSKREESSPSSAGEADQVGELELPPTRFTPNYQLGAIQSFQFAQQYGMSAIESALGSGLGELQARDLQSLITTGERRDTAMDYREERRTRVARERRGRRSSHLTQGAQREWDRNDNIDRFFGRS